MVDPKGPRVIVVVLLMKLLSKAVDYQFGSLGPHNFNSVNRSCQQREMIVSDFGSEDTATSWIYSMRYILPVLGGLLASRLGCLVVFQICGHIMLLCSILLAVSVIFQFICKTTVVVTVAWVLVPILFGIIQPCVLYCLYRWYREPRIWTILSGAYYISMKLGECIALVLPLLKSVMGDYYTLICIGLSVAFIALSYWIRLEERHAPLVLPTRARFIRYFKIFSPIMLFSISISNSRSIVYTTEIRYFLNVTETTDFAFESPEIMKVAGQIFWAIVLILVAYYSKKALSLDGRIYLGILLEALVSIGLLVASIVTLHGSTTVRIVFSFASAVDGVAEIFVISAAYEIMVGIAPKSCTLLLFGICLTVWGVATLIGRCLVALFIALPRSSPVLRPSPGQAPTFFIYHLTILALLGIAGVYFRCTTFRIAMTHFMSDDTYFDPMEDNENIPLLNSTSDGSRDGGRDNSA